MAIDRALREKLMVSGASALTDAELVAVVIEDGSEMLSPEELAAQILGEFDGSLSEMTAAGVSRLRQIAGCGTKRAIRIATTAELAHRIIVDKAKGIDTVGSKSDIARIFAHLGDLPHEEFWVVYLTSGGKIIDRTRASQGGVGGTVVDYKLIVKRAVELLASSIILVHNHPSGIAAPSGQDESVTEMVALAAGLFDIGVVDHIIIASGGVFSFRENGLIPIGGKG
jgi:DNA repair protein RadC